MATNTVAINIRGNTKDIKTKLDALQAQLGRLGTQAGTTRGKMSGLGTSFGSMVSKASALTAGFIGVASAIRGVGGAISTMANFGSEMSKVKAVSGATQEEFAALESKAREMGATTMFSASEAATGLKFLAMAGFDANEAVGALEPTLNLAQASATSLGRTADIMSNIMQAFGLETHESANAADDLATIVASSNTNLEQLGDAMKYVGASAKAMGIPMEDVAAGVGTLSNAGLQASMAGTGLRMILVKLKNDTSATTEALASMGLSLEDVDPEKIGLPAAMEKLKNAGMGAGEAMAIFGARGAAAALSLSAGMGTFDELRDKLANNAGAAGEMADIMEDNLHGAIMMAKSAFQELVLSQEGLGGAVSKIVNGFRAYIQLLNGSIDANDQFFATAQKIKSIIDKIIIVLKVLFAAFVFKKVIAGLVLLGNAFIALKAKIILATNAAVSGMFAATSATTAFKAALISTGIGALIVGLGTLIALATTWGEETEQQIERLKEQRRQLEAEREENQKGFENINSEEDYTAELEKRKKKIEEIEAKQKALRGVGMDVDFAFGSSSIGGGGVTGRSTTGVDRNVRSIGRELGLNFDGTATENMAAKSEGLKKLTEQLRSAQLDLKNLQSEEVRSKIDSNKIAKATADANATNLSLVKGLAEASIKRANTERNIKDTLTEEQKIERDIEAIKADQAKNEKARSENIFQFKNEAKNKELQIQLDVTAKQLALEKTKLAEDLLTKEKELADAKDKSLEKERAVISAQKDAKNAAGIRLLKAQAAEVGASGKPTKAAVAAKAKLAKAEDEQKIQVLMRGFMKDFDKSGRTNKAEFTQKSRTLATDVVEAERAAINAQDRKKTLNLGAGIGGVSSLAAIGGGGGVGQVASEAERQARVQQKIAEHSEQTAANTAKIAAALTKAEDGATGGSTFQVVA